MMIYWDDVILSNRGEISSKEQLEKEVPVVYLGAV